MIQMVTTEPVTSPFLFHAFFFSLKTCRRNYPQCNLATETSMGAIHQITCSFLWSYKRLYTTSVMYVVVLPKTCEHTLMYKISGVTL